MKLLVLFSGLVALWFAPPLLAESKECVPQQGCPADTGPPDCCQPPPCEYFEQIRTKQAVKRLFSKPKVRARFIREAGGDNARAAKLLNEWVVAEADKLGVNQQCAWEDPQPPPGFRVIDSCDIVAELPGGDELMGRNTAQKRTNSCSEFIEAAYDHEQVHVGVCNTKDRTERANEGISVYAREERMGYNKEIDSLKRGLINYWRACSSVFSADVARRVARDGVLALEGATPLQGPPENRAARAGKR
jgi:hypothetical protein